MRLSIQLTAENIYSICHILDILIKFYYSTIHGFSGMVERNFPNSKYLYKGSLVMSNRSSINSMVWPTGGTSGSTGGLLVVGAN